MQRADGGGAERIAIRIRDVRRVGAAALRLHQAPNRRAAKIDNATVAGAALARLCFGRLIKRHDAALVARREDRDHGRRKAVQLNELALQEAAMAGAIDELAGWALFEARRRLGMDRLGAIDDHAA